MTGWSFAAGAAVVRDRSGGACELCGGVGTQTHHRQPRGMGGVSGVGLAVNSPANLLRICGPCHRDAESRRALAYEEGWLVRRPTDPATVPARLRTAQGVGYWLLTAEGMYVWAERGGAG